MIMSVAASAAVAASGFNVQASCHKSLLTYRSGPTDDVENGAPCTKVEPAYTLHNEGRRTSRPHIA